MEADDTVGTMRKANIRDPMSVDAIYPAHAFDRDCRNNADPKVEIRRGVKILSGLDENGEFDLLPASQHVGEEHPEGDSVFLFPEAGQSSGLVQGRGYGAVEENPEAPAQAEPSRDVSSYEAFISRIIETASSARFPPQTGLHDPRLKGFHGG